MDYGGLNRDDVALLARAHELMEPIDSEATRFTLKIQG